MALTTKALFDLSAELTSALDLASGSVPLKYVRQFVWPSGTGAGQADLVWHDQRTLTASSTEDLDLAGGSLLNGFGAGLTFVKVRALIVYAAAGNTNTVVIGGDANSVPFLGAAANTKPIQPGGLYVDFAPAGYTVTATTGDIIQVANGGAGTSVTYDIVIIGTSA